MTIEKVWKRRQETKERLLELADRAPSERFWQASNADDDAALAFGHAVLEDTFGVGWRDHLEYRKAEGERDKKPSLNMLEESALDVAVRLDALAGKEKVTP
jgi:hypothetical protein